MFNNARIKALEKSVQALEESNRLDKASIQTQKDSILAHETRIANLEYVVQLSLPPLKILTYNILLRVASTHMFWASKEGRWLSVEDVNAREKEMRFVQYVDADASFTKQVEEVEKTFQEAAEAALTGFGVVRTAREKKLRSDFEKDFARTVRKASPVVLALPDDPSFYPAGRSLSQEHINFVKQEYVKVVRARNHVAHKATATTLSLVLKHLSTDPAHKASGHLNTMKGLYRIIFGFAFDSVPDSGKDIEIENYGSDGGETFVASGSDRSITA